jgi:ubiquinone/menaquinone biosynthesis C-methylase UbiE
LALSAGEVKSGEEPARESFWKTPVRVTVVRMADVSKFDSQSTARNYAAARPDYPPALFKTLDGLLAGRLSGARVIDVAAGTGIASRQLAERGARVVAVELSGAMLATLAADSRGVQAVQGSAHALPLADGSADMITCAQAWHWMDKQRAVAEARRVLRPGGVLAIWWNQTIYDADWERAHAARIAEAAPGWRRFSATEVTPDYGQTPGLTPQTFTFAWQRKIGIENFLRYVASRSYIAELGDAMPGFLDRERRILTEQFPEGHVTERFHTILLAAGAPES